MKRSIGHILLAGGVLLTAAGGCGSPYQTSAADVNPLRWEEPAGIRIENADTVTLRDAAIFLRYNDRFAEDTLTVRIATLSPDSLRFEEEFLLAIVRTGGPAALQHETLIPYRRRIRLLRNGEYRIFITPVRPVRGVEAVGVRLAKSY